MIDITTLMNDFLQKLNHTFVKRVWFIGLQGSYGRGEATETSDIDIVVILDVGVSNIGNTLRKGRGTGSCQGKVEICVANTT